jgi:hypothetical protein
VLGEQIIRIKSSFGTITKIDFSKISNILECAIMTIFLAVRFFQSVLLNLNSKFGDLI